MEFFTMFTQRADILNDLDPQGGLADSQEEPNGFHDDTLSQADFDLTPGGMI